MSDDVAMATRILEVAGLEVTDEARAALSDYVAGNPRGKDGRVVYDLRGDFGLDPSRPLRPLRLLLRRVPADPHGGALTMAGIHRERPGAADMAAATDSPAIDLGDDIWMSPGWSNSYLLPTDDGRVVINTGMGFEGPLHRRAYDAVDDTPTRARAAHPGPLRPRRRRRRGARTPTATSSRRPTS